MGFIEYFRGLEKRGVERFFRRFHIFFGCWDLVVEKMIRNGRGVFVEGVKMGDITSKDAMILDGLWCAFDCHHMGITGEVIVDKFGATREEQDAYAVSSHQKARHAIEKGYLKEEIVPVEVPQRKGDPILFGVDEGPRADASVEKLARLRPVFKKDGTVTAGNASSLNDAGAAVVVASADAVKERGLTPLARILGSAANALEPEMVM